MEINNEVNEKVNNELNEVKEIKNDVIELKVKKKRGRKPKK